MFDPTFKFAAFTVFNALCLGLGYVARHRKWCNESISRPIHLHTVVWLWSPVSLIAFWQLPMNRDLAMFVLLQPALMLVGWLSVGTIGAVRRWSGSQKGVMVLAAGLSNQGFALGAYLCYVLFEERGQAAMNYGIAYVTMQQVYMVIMLYPVAKHYGPENTGKLSRLILSSFVDVRSMPLYMSIVGISLNLAGVEPLAAFSQPLLMDAVFFTGAAGAYFGIGLRLHIAAGRFDLPLHAWLGITKFLLVPLAALGFLVLLHYLGLGLSDLPARVIVIESFTPVALNGVIVANLFRLDTRLASNLWLWSTVVFCVIITPILVLVF